jgi:hypothetical protein
MASELLEPGCETRTGLFEERSFHGWGRADYGESQVNKELQRGIASTCTLYGVPCRPGLCLNERDPEACSLGVLARARRRPG